MLKDNVEFLQSSIIPRKNKTDIFTSYVIPFGYIYAIKNYLAKPITLENIDEANQAINNQLVKNIDQDYKKGCIFNN